MITVMKDMDIMAWFVKANMIISRGVMEYSERGKLVWVIVDRDGKTMIMEWEEDDLREGMDLLSLEQLMKYRIVGNEWFPVDNQLHPAKLVELLSEYNMRMKRRKRLREKKRQIRKEECNGNCKGSIDNET